MSNVNHSFNAVWLENGKCPSAKRHFRGCAREVYGYLEKLAQNHGGFVFPTVANIAGHTRKWKTRHGVERYSLRECKRVIRIFHELGILEKSCVRTIRGRRYRGWQFLPHECWAESGGGMCELKHWERYDLKCQRFMHNNGTQNGTANGTNNGTHFAINGTQNVTQHSAVNEPTRQENHELQGVGGG